LQPLGRLVKKEQAWLEQHAPCDGEHLLLAAGQRSSRLTKSLTEDREKREDTVHHPFAGSLRCRKLEILPDGQLGENLAALGHVPNPTSGHPIWWPGADLLAKEPDPSRARSVETHDASKKRGLTHPISTKQADGLMFFDPEADAVENGVAGSSDIQIGDLEQAHAELPR
jgi:hypothetical protein